jgi:hypothetical protein
LHGSTDMGEKLESTIVVVFVSVARLALDHGQRGQDLHHASHIPDLSVASIRSEVILLNERDCSVIDLRLEILWIAL